MDEQYSAVRSVPPVRGRTLATSRFSRMQYGKTMLICERFFDEFDFPDVRSIP
jgi:hypothetical protein